MNIINNPLDLLTLTTVLPLIGAWALFSIFAVAVALKS